VQEITLTLSIQFKKTHGIELKSFKDHSGLKVEEIKQNESVQGNYQVDMQIKLIRKLFYAIPNMH